jgi:PII-like signaling protein
MEGSYLHFYVHEGERHAGRLVWEWLLQQADRMGVRGGTAFRAIGGFGRHRELREATFFELGGVLAIRVEFIVTDEEARMLLDLLRKEGLRLFYAQTPARFGFIDPDGN